MRRLVPVVGALLALALTTPAPAPAAPPRLLAGVNIGVGGYGSAPADADRMIASAAALHARIVRVEMPWDVFQPSSGQTDPSALAFGDRLAADASAAGVKLVMTLEGTPCWASSAPANVLRACVPGHSSRANSYPPRSAADFGAFAGLMAARYAPVLAAIEIWNEPDQANEDYLAGPNKAAHYAALLRAAYPAIKQAAPSVKVLGGSLVGSNGAFLRALYAAGIKGYYDGLSVHFYNLTLASLRSIHEVQLAAGDQTPLWLDEFGWTSCWPKQHVQQEQGCVTTATQALNLTNTFRTLARTPYVAAALVYKLQDSGNEDFGLLSQTGARKPAFRALASLLPGLGGAISPVTLALKAQRGSVVARGSAPVGDFMLLEAFQGSTLRYRVVFLLDRFNRFTLTLPRVLGTSGLTVRVYRYGSGPGSATTRSI